MPTFLKRTPIFHSVPDSDGVSEAGEQFLHVEESGNLLQNEPDISV